MRRSPPLEGEYVPLGGCYDETQPNFMPLPGHTGNRRSRIFPALSPHHWPVLPRSGDAHIQAVELRADGELRVWSPKTEEDREKELVILDFLAESRQRHLLPNHETDWSGDASQRQYMLIVIQNGSNLVNIDLAQDDIVGEGPFNMVFSDGCLFPSRGYLLTPGEIRTFVERTLDDANYTVSSAV